MPSEQAQEAFDAALNAHDGGDMAAAETSYKAAIAAEPGMTVAHNNLGMVLIQQERLEEAVESLSRAVELDPQYAEAYNNLGFAYRRLGRDVEAAEQYERFLGLTPDVEEAGKIRDWIARVRTEASGPEIPEAPQVPEGGEAVPPVGDPPEAGGGAEFAPQSDPVAMDPGAVDPGMQQQAAQMPPPVAPTAPSAPPEDQEFGEFFASAAPAQPAEEAPAEVVPDEAFTGDAAQTGVPMAAEVIPEGTFDGDAPPAEADDSGLSDKAEAEFEEMFGESGLAGGEGGEAAGEEDEDEEVGRFYTEAMTKFQDGDMGEAARFCSLALDRAPLHFPTLLLAGRVALSRQDHSRATAMLQKALEIRSDDPEVYYFLGQCYEKRGLLDEAQEVYKKCVEVAPDGPRAKRLAKWLEKQRSDSTVGEGRARCELCLRTVAEEEITAHEGRKVCRNCLETLGAKEQAATTPVEEEDHKAEKRPVPKPGRRSSPVLMLLLFFVVLGAGAYVGLGYFDVISLPPMVADLLGKKPVVKPPGNGKPIIKDPVPPPTTKVIPTSMDFQTLVTAQVRPLEELRVDAGGKLKVKWPGGKAEPPRNAESIRFELARKPEGMTVQSDSGLIRWVPGSDGKLEVPSDHNAVVRATCGKKVVQTQFKVKVRYRIRTPREVDVRLTDAHKADSVGLVFADFDGDALPDLAAGCGGALSGRITMMLSAGGTTEFGSANNWTLRCAPVGMAAGDLDGDGRVDLGWGGWTSGRLQLLRGAAGRAPFKPARASDTGALIEAVVLADLNGDRRIDMVAASRREGKLYARSARGDKLAETTLPACGVRPVLFKLSPAGRGADRVGVALAGGVNAGRLLVYSLRGGKLVQDQSLELPKGVLAGAASGDFTGDGKPDAALLYRGERGTLTVLDGADPRKLVLLPSAPVGRQPTGLAAGDVNGDDRCDLVVSSPEEVRLYLSAGRGRFLITGSYKVLGLAPPVGLWPARGGKPARAAVVNLKGRAWVLTLPQPMKEKPRPLPPPPPPPKETGGEKKPGGEKKALPGGGGS
jgi:Flp pilus assembly protein TadD